MYVFVYACIDSVWWQGVTKRQHSASFNVVGNTFTAKKFHGGMFVRTYACKNVCVSFVYMQQVGYLWGYMGGCKICVLLMHATDV